MKRGVERKKNKNFDVFLRQSRAEIASQLQGTALKDPYVSRSRWCQSRGLHVV